MADDFDGEDSDLDALLDQVLDQKYCKCCKKPLRSSAKTGYCRKKACRRVWQREAYQNNPAFRERVLAANRKWHKKRYDADPAWAATRRGSAIKRIKKAREDAKKDQQEGVTGKASGVE